MAELSCSAAINWAVLVDDFTNDARKSQQLGESFMSPRLFMDDMWRFCMLMLATRPTVSVH